MALHLREQITVAVVTAVTSLTTTGANVFRDRDTEAEPLRDAELPGLVVLYAGGDATIMSMGVNRLLERHLRLTIEAHVKLATGYGAKLNLILQEIEVALASASLGGAKYGHLTDEGAREVSAAGETRIARQSFTYEFYYVVAHNAPDVAH